MAERLKPPHPSQKEKNRFQGGTDSALLYEARRVEDAWLREFYTVDIGSAQSGILEQDGWLVKGYLAEGSDALYWMI